MSKTPLPPLTLVLGGVSSGKSSFAESLVFATAAPRHYIATAQAWDDEMQAKIDDHKTDRGPDWVTHETPLDVGAALAKIPSDAVALLDCATMWLNNHIAADADLDAAMDGLLADLAACPAPVVVVSNEVGLGGVSANALARRFARAQGRLNARLAAESDQAFLVVAGLPQRLK